jgi:hypothetical protein
MWLRALPCWSFRPDGLHNTEATTATGQTRDAHGQGVKAEPAGERFLWEFLFPPARPAPDEGQRLRPRVVVQESQDTGTEADLRCPMALLPTREARLRAADHAGHLPLWEVTVETHAPQVHAQGLRALGVSQRSRLPSSEGDATGWQLMNETLGLRASFVMSPSEDGLPAPAPQDAAVAGGPEKGPPRPGRPQKAAVRSLVCRPTAPRYLGRGPHGARCSPLGQDFPLPPPKARRAKREARLHSQLPMLTLPPPSAESAPGASAERSPELPTGRTS